MRIAYVNHGRFPTEKAHGFQIGQVCDALTALGNDVTLLSPAFRNSIAAAPQQYYGLRHPLRLEILDHFDAFQSRLVPGVLGFAVSMRAYGRALQKRLDPAVTPRFDLLYVRSPLLVPALLRTDIPLVLELHSLPRFARRRFVHACNRCALVVCLTHPMRDQLIAWGARPENIVADADAADLRRFENLPDPAAAKWRWKLPADRMVVGYVGSLATRETLEKGVRELIDAMAIMKSHGDIPLLWIVGGPQAWIDTYRAHALSKGLSPNDVRFEGRVDAAAAPSAIAACDVCVYPAPATDHPYFMRDTSPLKLFEYLAAGRPVACASLPPVRDVVDERSVRFFRPGDAQGIADAITEILKHPDAAAKRAQEGKTLVQEHSWEKRMARILRAVSGTVRA